MTFDILLGMILMALALGATVFLTLKCRNIIERIHLHRPSSLRHIQKEILHDEEPGN